MFLCSIEYNRWKIIIALKSSVIEFFHIFFISIQIQKFTAHKYFDSLEEFFSSVIFNLFFRSKAF